MLSEIATNIVLTDRCFDASIAYQGYARGIDISLIEYLSLLATQGYKPGLTILLDLDPSEVHRRTDVAQDQSGIRDVRTHFDSETEAFHRRVQEGLHALARAHPEHIKVIDASRTPEEIHMEIIGLVEALL